MSKGDPLEDWRSNPFFVLEISTEASRAEVERAGQKLLALLAVGRTAAEHYQTTLGPATRDADKVRQALAALRDPNERVLHELWASIAPGGAGDEGENVVQRWEAAASAVGWIQKWPG
jgi:hypothetical protein